MISSSFAWDFFAQPLLRATGLLLAAFALAWLLRRASAASRHLLWACALGGLLALPVLSWLSPWNVSVHVPWTAYSAVDTLVLPGQPVAESGTDFPTAPQQAGNATGNSKTAFQTALIASSAQSSHAQLPNPAAKTENNPPAATTPASAATVARVEVSNSFEALLLPLWLAGVFLSLGWLLLGTLHLRRLSRRSRVVDSGVAFEWMHKLASELGISRPVRLLMNGDRKVPMTWGWRRPVILLPEEANSWSAERLRMVLLHELGHVSRGDWLTQIVGFLARGLYWFHPLAWLALARLRAEQENACDDLVVNAGAQPQDYAGHLLAITARLPGSLVSAPVALGMARSANLRRRIVALLDEKRSRRGIPRRGLLFASTTALAVLAVLACLVFAPARAQMPPATTTPASPQAGALQQGEKSGDTLKSLQEVQQKLREIFVGPVDDKKLAEAALRGLLKALDDPYTDYVPGDEFTQLQTQLQGNFAGIGAQLAIVNKRLSVVTPLENSPALKAGLRPGDAIDEINGASTHDMPLQKAVQTILGEPGTSVKLKVTHVDGKVEELNITRARVNLRTVHGFRRGDDGKWVFIVDPENKIGYVQVLQFNKTTAKDLRDSISAQQKDGLKGLIVDLRFCPGGLLDAALDTCKLFLAKGTILKTRGPGTQERSWEADGKDTLGDFPVVVLVNEHTASAAEIVAGSLADHQRAVVVGSRTFGKGSVQMIVKLEEGGALKVTTAYHYLPGGRNIQKRPGEAAWGVDPNDGYYVPLSKAQIEALDKKTKERTYLGWKKEDQPKHPARLTAKAAEETYGDPQLAAALRTLSAKLSDGAFVKVGQSDALLKEQMKKLEEMWARREAIVESLNRLDRDIADLQQSVPKEKKD
ncbi:MAG: S41 family peptidase [Gemmataceae bacterium]|nr:S41 family peptidase [Gemmataceae bacterium]